VAEQDVLTGQSRLVTNVITSWLSYIVFFIAGFLLPHLIDDNLGPAQLGIWDFGWSLVNYISFSALGIGSSLNRYVATHRAKGESREVSIAASTVLVIQIALCFLVLIISAGVALLVPNFLPENLNKDIGMMQLVVFLLGASLAFQFLFDTSRGILTGCHRWDIFNGLNAGCYFVTVVIMIFCLLQGYGLVQLSLTYLIMTIVQGVIRTIVANRVCPESAFHFRNVSIDFARTIFIFGGKSIVLSISPVVVIQSSYLLVMAYLGPVALAILARPVALMRHIENFLSRFTFILTPMAGSIDALGNRQELKKFAITSARFGFAFTLPIVVLFTLYGGKIIELWMGSDFVNTTIITILAVGYCLPISQSAIIRVLVGLDLHGRAAAISISLTITLYIISIATVILTQPSITGFVCAIVVPLTIVNGIVIPFYACGKLGISANEYIRDAFGKVSLIATLATTQLFLFDHWFQPGALGALINTAVYGFIYLLLYWRYLLTTTMKATAMNPVRKLLISLLSSTGLIKRVPYLYRNTIPVLTLHGTSNSTEEDFWTPTWPRCSIDRLDIVLRILSRYYTFLSLADATDMLSGRTPFKPYSMVLTFDDGYENNVSEALPILQKYNVPFNFFVVTRMMREQQPFWVDRLDYSLQQLGKNQHTLKTAGVEKSIVLNDLTEMASSFKEFRDSAGKAHIDDYHLISSMERLAQELETSTRKSLLRGSSQDKWSSVVTEDQLNALPPDATIGSHTVNHVRVDYVSETDLRKELLDSKATLANASKTECDFFCYPNGNFNDATAKLVEECGYKSAFTGRAGTNKVGADLFKLKRVSFPKGTKEEEILYQLLRGFTY
jgi:peptidoglycan/xylan/chitin deacetylase (PgdA/CDA1 family)/O-antigen/teichoic acid export membrane protein